MADDSDQQATRTQADKERSRQQSRAVSGKEAARGSGAGRGSKTAPKGTPAKGGTGPGRQPQAKGGNGKGGQRPPRYGTAAAAPPRRSRTALLTWGIVALVLVVVIVLVVVKLTGGSTTLAAANPPPGPVPAVVAHQVTHIPASVYDTIGVTVPKGLTLYPPKALHGQPALTVDGKPKVFYMGGEFCPFCAAERWAMIATFSRFGTLSGLKTMHSYSTDTDPNTPTFSFVTAKLTSPYFHLVTREYYSNRKGPSGSYEVLQPLTKAEQALATKYDTSKYTGGSTTSSGSIPFIDIGNKWLVAGSSFAPSLLAGLTRTQIAAGLTTTKSPVTRAIIATSNYLSAAICSTTGQQPASVCTSPGVTAAAKALGSHT